jgi:hypothetical protein
MLQMIIEQSKHQLEMELINSKHQQEMNKQKCEQLEASLVS